MTKLITSFFLDSGWYSVSDEAFYNEDEIEDIDGVKRSISSKSNVEWIEEESYFFRLSKWEKPLLDYYEKHPKFIAPESRKNEVISFVKSGLKDLSVSRKSFSWGIKVPNNDDHVIYVWLDALTNYISALNYPDINNQLFKNFWPASILSLIHISEPTRQAEISYAVFCLKKMMIFIYLNILDGIQYLTKLFIMKMKLKI